MPAINKRSTVAIQDAPAHCCAGVRITVEIESDVRMPGLDLRHMPRRTAHWKSDRQPEYSLLRKGDTTVVH